MLYITKDDIVQTVLSDGWGQHLHKAKQLTTTKYSVESVVIVHSIRESTHNFKAIKEKQLLSLLYLYPYMSINEDLRLKVVSLYECDIEDLTEYLPILVNCNFYITGDRLKYFLNLVSKSKYQKSTVEEYFRKDLRKYNSFSDWLLRWEIMEAKFSKSDMKELERFGNNFKRLIKG